MPPKRKTIAADNKAAPAKKAKVQGAKSNSNNVSDDDEPKTTKIIIKGRVPVDPQCTGKVNVAHVLQEGDNVYNFMLNQTNLQHNNNKYYMGQVLEDDNGGNFSVWFRWGRVGKTAQTSLQSYFSKQQAIQEFVKKFRAKTGNDWGLRANFTKRPGLYDLIEQDFGDPAEDEEEVGDDSKNVKKEAPKSLLPPQVLALIELISDINAMEHQMREMNYDARRAPLGKLTPAQIKAGYEALKEISDCVEALKKLEEDEQDASKAGKGKVGKRKRTASTLDDKKALSDKLLQACNAYYTRIPHDFGMRVPPLISTPDDVKTELDLLKALEDIEAAFSIIKTKGKTADMHPADKNYSNLKCDIKPLPHGHKMEKIIKDYVRMTHAPTHNNYDLEVLQTFELAKDGEAESFQDYGTRRLLWHGSRMTNWMGILGRGLKIAPPEAPSTGYMFGKGVYFADCASKSANYTYASISNNVGLMALCEVSLGEINPLLNSDFNANKLPKGKHSVQGVGSNVPNKSTWVTLDDGVVVPCGEMVESGVKNASLYYNEFIVYDVRQIRLRYLVQMKFNYKF
ncbi:unnamed protein product [Hymenolepis diminuta]|uniref:Poly [ADP-ribose] polymerase n=1 Tax=Hymenolepis diminuta TaxID=6216 RepID=A0A564Y9Z8_HYMDI|nr:unnamed protein product [Hymenolepis diminuta]